MKPRGVPSAGVLLVGAAVTAAFVVLAQGAGPRAALASVSGSVTDASGQPIPGVLVAAASPSIRNSDYSQPWRRSTGTDRAGHYTLDGLSAGDHLLVAIPPAASPYERAFFPAAASLAEASTVALKAGDARTANFVLQTPPRATVSGQVSGLPGTSTNSPTVRLVRIGDRLLIASVEVQTVDQNDRFVFRDVKSGRYRLFARAYGHGAGSLEAYWGETEVVVAGVNRGDVSLMLHPGATISGRVVTESAFPQAGRRTVAVTAGGTGDAGTLSYEMAVGAWSNGGSFVNRWRRLPAEDGSFSIEGLAPSPLRLGIIPEVNTDLVLKSAMFNGRDLADFPITLGPGEHADGVVVTVSDRTTEVAGVVADASHSPRRDVVLMFSVDRQYWTRVSRRVAIATSKQDGTYSLRGLPAGDYFAVLLGDGPVNWRDPAALATFAANADRITLRDGERTVRDFSR